MHRIRSQTGRIQFIRCERAGSRGRGFCGPCHAVHPVLEGLAGETEKVEFVKLNIDDNPVAASKYGVLSIPTVILFDGGEPKETVVGARPKAHFEKALAPFIAG